MPANRKRAARPLDQFARMVVDVARAAAVKAVICVTETGRAFHAITELSGDLRLIAATPSANTFDALQSAGCEVVKLPVRVPSRFKESRHALSIVLKSNKIHAGDLVLCVIGQGLPEARGDFMVLLDTPLDAARVTPLHDLINLAGGIRPDVLDAVLDVACHIGGAAQRGKRVGATFVVGDSERVLDGARQLILNPFQGHPEAERMITDSATHGMLLELAKLDGAFVVRGDGFIQRGGVFLQAGPKPVDLPAGLGARHMTAAAVSARTRALAIVVSATDGSVRAFTAGRIVLHIDPAMSPELLGLGE